MMREENQVREWRKQLRRSWQALPFGLILMVLASWLLFTGIIPDGFAWIVFAVVVFAVLGDTINILYLTVKLRRAPVKRV
jgi:hypothetical protein